MSRQGIALGAVVGALAVGIGAAAAFAAVPIPGTDGKIRACVKYEDIDKYEQMRWITKTTCPKGEKLITWNAKGVKGDKGATGPIGPAGPPGADGADGAPAAYFDSKTNNGYGLGDGYSTILTLTVPAGSYAVTATTEIVNYYDDPHDVFCALKGYNSTVRHTLVDPDKWQVMTVIGRVTTDDGKITLVCGGTVNQAGEADNPAIMAIRIS